MIHILAMIVLLQSLHSQNLPWPSSPNQGHSQGSSSIQICRISQARQWNLRLARRSNLYHVLVGSSLKPCMYRFVAKSCQQEIPSWLPAWSKPMSMIDPTNTVNVGITRLIACHSLGINLANQYQTTKFNHCFTTWMRTQTDWNNSMTWIKGHATGPGPAAAKPLGLPFRCEVRDPCQKWLTEMAWESFVVQNQV